MANEVRTGVHNALPHKVVDLLHHECHVGQVCYNQVRMPAIASAATSNLVIVTSNKEVHWHPHLITSGPFYIDFFEGASVSSYGAVLASVNYNRNFTTSCQTVTYLNSATSEGTNIWSGMVVSNTAGGSGSFQQISLADEMGTQIEFILKPSTIYRTQFINVAGTQTMANYHAFFYERGT